MREDGGLVLGSSHGDAKNSHFGAVDAPLADEERGRTPIDSYSPHEKFSAYVQYRTLFHRSDRKNRQFIVP